MNKLLLTLLILTCLSANSQSVFNFRRDMVWVANANLFVCKYEVTNIEYLEFTNELIADSLNIISRQTIIDLYYPDTLVWIRQLKADMGEGMHKYYRWHPAFKAFPVVGLKYEAALKYCEWLTKKYGNGKYRFRLPTSKEFMQYSYVSSSNIAGGIESPRTDKRRYIINYKPDITNLDDSTSKVFYNPRNKTFMRIYDDTANQSSYFEGIEPYTNWVENYLNEYLYIGLIKGQFYKFKVQDSITFYNKETNSYSIEKLILHTKPNYYNDGFIYSSPSRAIKGNHAYFHKGEISLNAESSIISNKSTFPADKNGLYDLAGNVSEMIYEKGNSMGGNWNSVITELNYNYAFESIEPHVLIGFRIVAERLK